MTTRFEFIMNFYKVVMILCNDIIFIIKFVDKYISTCRCSCMFFSADEMFTDCNLYYQLILNILGTVGVTNWPKTALVNGR